MGISLAQANDAPTHLCPGRTALTSRWRTGEILPGGMTLAVFTELPAFFEGGTTRTWPILGP